MNKREPPVMQRLFRPGDNIRVQIEEAKLVGQPMGGAEKTVNRARLYYPDHGKTVAGLVLITAPEDDSGFAQPAAFDKFVGETLQKWRYLKAVNQRRRGENKTVLTLPETIRYYRDDDFTGILMTDITENNQRPLTDLKALESGQLTREQWVDVRCQVIRDLNIAAEENILLGGGASKLDAWACVYDTSKKAYTVYLLDVGRFLDVDADGQVIQERNLKIMKELDTKERELFANS